MPRYYEPVASQVGAGEAFRFKIQALDRMAPCLAILPTSPAWRTHDCVHDETTSRFAVFEIGSGSVFAQSYR